MIFVSLEPVKRRPYVKADDDTLLVCPLRVLRRV